MNATQDLPYVTDTLHKSVEAQFLEAVDNFLAAQDDSESEFESGKGSETSESIMNKGTGEGNNAGEKLSYVIADGDGELRRLNDATHIPVKTAVVIVFTIDIMQMAQGYLYMYGKMRRSLALA